MRQGALGQQGTRSSCALLLLLFLSVLAAPRPAAAQVQSVAIESLTLTLLPQYDDRRLLVLYEAELAEAGVVAFGVPSGVELHAAAFRDAEGTLRELPATFVAESDGRYVRFDAPTREVRLELYHDVVPLGSAQRFVDWTLPRQATDIPYLLWRVVFPLDATSLVTDPPMIPTGENHLGMLTFQREAGVLPRGETSHQSVEWVRESDQPSILLPDDDEAVPPLEQRSRTPILLGGGLLFLVGLLLVLDGVRKARAGV